VVKVPGLCRCDDDRRGIGGDGFGEGGGDVGLAVRGDIVEGAFGGLHIIVGGESGRAGWERIVRAVVPEDYLEFSLWPERGDRTIAGLLEVAEDVARPVAAIQDVDDQLPVEGDAAEVGGFWRGRLARARIDRPGSSGGLRAF